MENLAGNKNCDPMIQRELATAGIDVVRQLKPSRNEVPAAIIGKLGDFTFQRAWYYWIVEGNVPLAVANELYQNPEGSQSVRAAGYAGGIVPSRVKEKINGLDVVTSYHIDTQEGLSLFTETLRKHKLAPEVDGIRGETWNLMHDFLVAFSNSPKIQEAIVAASLEQSTEYPRTTVIKFENDDYLSYDFTPLRSLVLSYGDDNGNYKISLTPNETKAVSYEYHPYLDRKHNIEEDNNVIAIEKGRELLDILKPILSGVSLPKRNLPSFRKVAPGVLVREGIKVEYPHPEECFIVRNQDGTATLSVGEGSLGIFSDEKSAQTFIEKAGLEGTIVETCKWDELVDKYGESFSSVTVDHRNEAGFYSTIPLQKGI